MIPSSKGYIDLSSSIIVWLLLLNSCCYGCEIVVKALECHLSCLDSEATYHSFSFCCEILVKAHEFSLSILCPNPRLRIPFLCYFFICPYLSLNQLSFVSFIYFVVCVCVLCMYVCMCEVLLFVKKRKSARASSLEARSPD